MGKMEKLKRHFDRFLLLYIALAMVGGLAVGVPFFREISSIKAILKQVNLIIIIFMIYPMMVGLNFGEIKNIHKMWKQFSFAIVMGMVYAPLFMVLLTKVIPMNSYLSFGLALVFSVPCTSMAIAATGLSKGNTELATILVAVQFILALFVSPLWISMFGKAYHIKFPMLIIIQTIVLIVLIPMLVGYATKSTIVAKGGHKALSKARSVLPVASFLALFTMIFMIFMEQGHLILVQWHSVLITFIPLIIYYAVTIALLTFLDLAFNMKYRDHMAVVFGTVGKNEGTAMAIALAGGIGLAAVPAAIAPLIQVPLLASYLRAHWKIATLFARKSPHLVNEYELHEITESEELAFSKNRE